MTIIIQKEVKMGKNKKVGNVFKVAGAKSLKLKAKAKAVKTDLKQINVKNKVAEIDKALEQLENKMRVPEVPPSKKPSNPKTNLPSAINENSADTERKAEEALNSLNNFQM